MRILQSPQSAPRNHLASTVLRPGDRRLLYDPERDLPRGDLHGSCKPWHTHLTCSDIQQARMRLGKSWHQNRTFAKAIIFSAEVVETSPGGPPGGSPVGVFPRILGGSAGVESCACQCIETSANFYVSTSYALDAVDYFRGHSKRLDCSRHEPGCT